MEFDVIDPKKHSFDEWLTMVDTFLVGYTKTHNLSYTRREGSVYYAQDDIADVWSEDTVLFEVEGESGGLIEVRDGDENIYLFTDDFAGRNLKDSKDGHTFHITRPRVVYGFKHSPHPDKSEQSIFYGAPIHKVYFMHQGDSEEFILPTSCERLWSKNGGLQEIIQWVHNQTGRIQEQKGITNVERSVNIFQLQVGLTHPALVTHLLEAVRSRNAISERDPQGRYVGITLENPNSDHLRDIFNALPSEPEYFDSISLNMSWGVELIEAGERQEVTYIGAEKRAMKPMVQLPRRKTSKLFKDAFKAHFKGYRLVKHVYHAE